MWLNIMIAVAVGLLGYVLTLYFDHSYQPPVRPVIKEVPASPPAATAQMLAPGVEIPEFSFTDTRGVTHSSKDFAGKRIILNFWASWCAPCVKEFPDLLAVTEKFKDDTVLIALSYDFEEEPMNRFLDRIMPEGPPENVFIAMDKDKSGAQKFGAYRLPETILIDRDQKFGHKFVGALWTRPEFEAELTRLAPAPD